MGSSVAAGKLIHEKNQKQKISWHCPFKDFWDGLANRSDLQAFFSPLKVNLKIPINSRLWQAGIARPWKMAWGCGFHKNLFWYLATLTSIDIKLFPVVFKKKTFHQFYLPRLAGEGR